MRILVSRCVYMGKTAFGHTLATRHRPQSLTNSNYKREHTFLRFSFHVGPGLRYSIDPEIKPAQRKKKPWPQHMYALEKCSANVCNQSPAITLAIIGVECKMKLGLCTP